MGFCGFRLKTDRGNYPYHPVNAKRNVKYEKQNIVSGCCLKKYGGDNFCTRKTGYFTLTQKPQPGTSVILRWLTHWLSTKERYPVLIGERVI